MRCFARALPLRDGAEIGRPVVSGSLNSARVASTLGDTLPVAGALVAMWLVFANLRGASEVAGLKEYREEISVIAQEDGRL